MIRSKLIATCHDIIRDSEDGSASLIKLFDALETRAQFPLSLPQVVFFAWTQRDAGDPSEVDFQLRVTVGEHVLLAQQTHIDYGDKLRNQFALKLQGLPVPGPGPVVFTITHDGQELGTTSFEMKQLPPLNGPEVVATTV